MSEPFIAEIKIFSFSFAPKGWALCNGQLLPIAQNQALFSILGTTYGGNGQTNFALPNLQGRTPIHSNSAFPQGLAAGEATHTLTIAEMPAHPHFLLAQAPPNGDQNTNNPSGAYLTNSSPAEVYTSNISALTSLRADAVSNYGGSQPHNNMQPYLTLNFCIALVGIFPSRT